jgi:hypothetical protein
MRFYINSQMLRVNDNKSDKLEFREPFSFKRALVSGVCFGVAILIAISFMTTKPISNTSDLFIRVAAVAFMSCVPFFFGFAVGFHYGHFIIDRKDQSINAWSPGTFPYRPKTYDLRQFLECIVTGEMKPDDNNDESQIEYSVRALLSKEDAVLWTTFNQTEAEDIAKDVNLFMGIQAKAQPNIPVVDPQALLRKWAKDKSEQKHD